MNDRVGWQKPWRLELRVSSWKSNENRPYMAVANVRSNLELDANLHNLRTRYLEIGARALRVMVHEREQFLAPSCQA
jgi:hypothetical protein